MPEALDLRSAFEAAEQAAAAGDYMAAERHLSGAASQQEASLGPLHPDLANTLNNLGVVYETIDRPADAERCYRRAYSIAIAALEPDHPFVATSEKNLRDFCEARGKPFELPTPLPAITPPPEPAAAPSEVRSSAAPRERPAEASESQPVGAGNASRLRAAAVLGVVVIAALIVARLWFSPNEAVESAQEVATPPPLESAAPISEPPAVKPIAEPPAAKPIPEPSAVAPPPVAPRTASKSERAVAVAGNRRIATPVSASPTMVEANLCSELSTREWRCNAAIRSAESGQLFFYTRVKSPTDTTVEHRWYHGDRLHRRVVLRIQANQRSGYRTYSRTAVNAGNWRVEVRTRDGALLHEEDFVVR